MAALSSYLEDQIADHILSKTTFTAGATLYFALFTSAPTEDGGGTECNGGSYARVAVTNNATNFPASSGGVKTNGTAVTFPTASGNWGTVVAFGVFDASTAGNLYFFGPLSTSRAITSGDTARFAIGDFSLTFE